MTHIPDLAPVSYTGLKGPIRAIGWLESSHAFRRGSIEPGFSRRLIALIQRPAGAFYCLGMHWCSLCAAEGKIGPDCRSSQNVLLVPAADCVYEAPIWIGHYVLGHSYQPPDEFCRAVLSSPEPGSDAFRSALVAHLPQLNDRVSDDFPFFGKGYAQFTLQPSLEHGSEEQVRARCREAPEIPEWLAARPDASVNQESYVTRLWRSLTRRKGAP
jgi:hypothetical protein